MVFKQVYFADILAEKIKVARGKILYSVCVESPLI